MARRLIFSVPGCVDWRRSAFGGRLRGAFLRSFRVPPGSTGSIHTSRAKQSAIYDPLAIGSSANGIGTMIEGTGEGTTSGRRKISVVFSTCSWLSVERLLGTTTISCISWRRLPQPGQPEEPKAPEHPCPCCGGSMRIIETFLRGQQPKNRPTPIPPKIRINTS